MGLRPIIPRCCSMAIRRISMFMELISVTLHSVFRYIKGSVDEEQKYKPENNNNIAEIIVETEAETYTITRLLHRWGNVEVRYLNQRLSTPLSGKEDLLPFGKILKFSEARGLTGAELIPAIVAVSSTANPKYLMPFNSFEELNRYVKREHKILIEVVLEVERNLQGTSTEEIMLKVAEYWRVMKASVKKGIKSKALSLLKLTGKDAERINRHVRKRTLFDNIYGRATAYAVAVMKLTPNVALLWHAPQPVRVEYCPE